MTDASRLRISRDRWRKSARYHARLVRRLRARLHELLGDWPRSLGRYMAAAVGWVGAQWSCLDRLWGPLEGSWNVHADNPHSDAYGIPQALPGSKMGPGWQDDPHVQIRWGIGYIRGRFGTPCGALSSRLANGWY